MNRAQWTVLVPLLVIALALGACGGSDSKGGGETDVGQAQDAGVTPDAGTKDAGGLGLDDAKPAPELAKVTFSRAVAAVVPAGRLTFLLHADKDVTLQDFTNPKAPKALPAIPTTGRVVACEYDEEGQVAYIADATGTVAIYSLANPEAPVKLGEVTVGAVAGKVTAMARVGGKVFLSAGTTLQPLSITFAGQTATITPLNGVTLPEAPKAIAAGGGALALGFDDGTVESWSVPSEVASPPVKAGSHKLNGKLTGLLVRGNKIIGTAKDAGLSIVDFTDPAAPSVVYTNAEFKDAYDVRLFGRTLVVGLSRGMVSSLDVSDFAKPRALTTNKSATIPTWVATVDGNLLFGDATGATISGVPPVVAGRVPAITKASFPIYGSIPLTFSKPVDPASVTTSTVKLTVGGKPVAGTVTVSPDKLRLTFIPSAALEKGKAYQLDLAGVNDTVGLPVQQGGAAGSQFEFQTASADPDEPVVNKGSAYPHKVDGRFTDWVADAKEYEWFDVAPAKGMYTYFYADFDGKDLYLFNDWFYNGENIDPDCYNLFNVWTAGGVEQWEIRAYGDKKVKVFKNGVEVEKGVSGVLGGYYYGPSPSLAEPHTQYELKIPAGAGAWGVQLHDPGPTFNCKQLESEPTTIQGNLAADADGGTGTQTTIDPRGKLNAPTRPVLIEPGNGVTGVSTAPYLSWESADQWSSFVSYYVFVSRSASTSDVFYAASTSARSFSLPAGLLRGGTQYWWAVLAYNAVGQTLSDTSTFTTMGGDQDGGTGDGGQESCSTETQCPVGGIGSYQACCTVTQCRFVTSDGTSFSCSGTNCQGEPTDSLFAWCRAQGGDGGYDAGTDGGVFDAGTDAGTDGGMFDVGIDAGTGDGGVVTDGGAVPTPYIDSISPTSGDPNQMIYLQVTGSDFAPSAMMYLNDARLGNIYIEGTTSVSWTIPGNTLSEPGVYRVYMQNVQGDPLTQSNTLYYTINPPAGTPIIVDYSPDNGQQGDTIKVIGTGILNETVTLTDRVGNPLTVTTRNDMSYMGTMYEYAEFVVPMNMVSGPITITNSKGSFKGKWFNVGYNLTRTVGTVTTASSSYDIVDYIPSMASDNSLETSWFTANYDCVTAVGCTTTPWLLITFPADQTVGKFAIRGNRVWADGFDFVKGRLEFLDAMNGVVWGQSYSFALPDRDLDVTIGKGYTVRKVKFTSLADESTEPGLSEIELFNK